MQLQPVLRYIPHSGSTCSPRKRSSILHGQYLSWGAARSWINFATLMVITSVPSISMVLLGK
jgi:hypothetical protein